MSTNFYWIKEKIENTKAKKYMEVKKKQDIEFFGDNYDRNVFDGSEEYFYHIGKRSAAGYYCHDCNITSCRSGDAGVHFSRYRHDNKCPVCGKDLTDSFTCSFTWYDESRDKHLFEFLKDNNEKIIVDENGEYYTIQEFVDEVKKYKIKYNSHDFFS